MADRDFWVQQTVSPLGSDTDKTGNRFPLALMQRLALFELTVRQCVAPRSPSASQTDSL